MLPPPPTTLGGLQLCGEEKQKNVAALLAGKITVKFELSLIGLILILNIDNGNLKSGIKFEKKMIALVDTYQTFMVSESYVRSS